MLTAQVSSKYIVHSFISIDPKRSNSSKYCSLAVSFIIGPEKEKGLVLTAFAQVNILFTLAFNYRSRQRMAAVLCAFCVPQVNTLCLLLLFFLFLDIAFT